MASASELFSGPVFCCPLVVSGWLDSEFWSLVWAAPSEKYLEVYAFKEIYL